MKEKMQRFLKSIHIENPERFDIDFDLVARNAFVRQQVDMVIVKKTPWVFDLLEEFQNGLSTITYPYMISFSYIQKPTVYEAIQLFEDWHRSHNRFPSQITLEASGNAIKFIFNSDQQKADYDETLKDFKEFLNFLNYQFEFVIEVDEPIKEEPTISKKEMKVIEKNAKKAALEDDSSDKDDDEDTYYKDSKEIEEQNQQDQLKEMENQYLKEMEANLVQMKKDYNNYKKGKSKSSWRDDLPYVHFDNFNDINPDSGNVDIAGEVFGVDKIKTNSRNKATLAFGLGNEVSAISVKAVENETMTAEEIAKIKNGMNIRISGYASRDFNNQLIVQIKNYKMLPPKELRKDEEEEKRVELHLHTKMSTMDGVSSITDYCNLAKNMGHKAIAVTDHGVVQSYPEAQNASKDTGVKIIYGCELYVVDDDLPFALNPKDVVLNNASYVVFDLETTGLSTRYDGITEFGGVKFENGRVVSSLDILINPEMPIPEPIQKKTKITDELVKNCPTIKEVMPKILEFFGDSILVSHNITFDIGHLNEALRKMGKEKISNPLIDTLSLSRYMFPDSRNHRLGTLSRRLGFTIYDEDDAHRADYDANVLNDVWQAMLSRLMVDNYNIKHSDLANFKVTTTMYQHMRPFHATVLVKDKQGLHDLYHIISESHTTYFADTPKTPKTLLTQLRSHLLVGSACLNGDVFENARTRSREDLKKAVSYYDYIEVQPLENYRILLDRGNVYSFEQIKTYIKDIIEVADELHIPVVATGDVHYRDPEDKRTRDVYIASLGVGKKPHPLFVSDPKIEAPNQHYRSTKEMLDAFEFLGKEKAKEIVVTNTNMIADLTEELKPVQKELHPPVIEESPTILRNETDKKAKELYGDPIPQVVRDRLDKELNGIIGNGYSVTYYIARRIVEKANNDGYIVGSRGSVGSSLAAHLFGITEVNPLPPHYRCPHCKYLEFNDNPKYLSGFDLPDKRCPNCGEKLVKDGQNIPFETFLGFKGDKIPDIDLNFPSDYQQHAFDYTKVVFGEHNVFRAGTIETVADKTAFGYVRGYFERHGIDPNKISSQYIAYLASHCMNVKRTTGQHPGGIMVLPKGLSIYDFTPIQYPADNIDSTWYTTHLDYRALHDALLKLDLLGHVDPLALRLMCTMTGLDIKEIPLDDVKVISLFTSDKALNRKQNYLKTLTGVTGLPEFGTETGQDILLDAKPQSFADLVVIAGLAHGTNVWAHNSQDLIRNGTCTIRDVIGCRDDIMTYLIGKGVPNDISFKIMEDVRKGRKLKPEYEQIMLANKVPQWYLDSCNKIEYLFPKGHAVAYVTMAVRVGYFKIYYPLEFYAVWFSVRCKAYDIEVMLKGYEAIITRYEDLKRKKNNRGEKLSPKEKDIFNMLKIAIEMYERGYKFENIDLYKSEATTFVVDHERKALIPPFIALDGLGDSAGESVVEARKEGKFATKEDLLKRTKLNGTNVEQLSKLGVLDGLSDTDQVMLFDF